VLVATLVLLWGLRLSGYLLWRNWGKGEDFRYRRWRERDPENFWWKSYFRVFLLQGAVLWIISQPLRAAQQSPSPDHLTAFDIIGAAVWALGFLFEAVGDYQLARFKANPANEGKVMDRGVEFVMTSNYHPDQLYAHGLQRERFLPAIGFIKSRLDVVGVDNGTDYRRLKMEQVSVYHTGPQADPSLEKIFHELKDVEEERQPLDVEGRAIPYRKRSGGVVWFGFDVLCGGARSYADYVDLAKRFHTVILSGVPRLSAKQSDAARRFTWLIDVLYDERVKLIVSAAAAPEELFTEGESAAEFQRTVSRLHEMQSSGYRQAPLRRGSQ